MPFREADRGQAIQVGVVLLFGVLVVALSLYQAVIVPNQNQQVETNHLQTVEGDMHDLRNGIVNVPTTGNGRSVRMTLGTTYPARAIALNPPSPSGQLRTIGTSNERVNFTVGNARAINPETADYWNGTNRTRDTGSVVYDPNYHEFQNPPDLVYDSTTLLSRFDDATLWASGQTMFDGQRITLVAFDGDYDRGSSQSVSVDLDPISASTTDVAITNETGENVTVQFASQRTASAWRSLLREEEQWYNQSGSVVDVSSGGSLDSSFDLVTVELEQDQTYTLRMAKVGMGTGTTNSNTTYITSIGPTNVSQNEEVVAEVRDEFNNPISGVEVTPNVRSGTCDIDPKRTDSFGQVYYQCDNSAEVQLKIGDRDYETVSATVTESGSDTQEKTLIYNDDAEAFDNTDADDTEGGVEFTMTNSHGQDVTIYEVKINETSSGSIQRLNDKATPNDVPRGTEIYIDGDLNNGWVDVDGGVDIAHQFDMDADGFNNNGNPQISDGGDLRMYLYEFENNGGNREDMSGESFNATVFYETADGTSFTKQIRVSVP